MADSLLIYRICETIKGVIGIMGNGLVIIVIWRVSSMHKASIALICHQAVIDFLGSLVLLLKRNILVSFPLPETQGGELLCKMWIGDAVLFPLFVTSTYNLLALTLGRYFSIVYPLRLRLMRSRKCLPATIVVVWLIGTAIKSYSFLLLTVVDGKCIYWHLVASKVMGPLIICLQFFIPMTIMFFCYIHMGVTLKRQANCKPLKADDDDQHQNAATAFGQHPRLGQQQQHSHHQQVLRVRRDVLETLVIVFATFVLCWAPTQVIVFMFNMGWMELRTRGTVRAVFVMLTSSHCCVNPIIYCFKYKLFRRALRQVLGRPANEQYDGLVQPGATRMTWDNYGA